MLSAITFLNGLTIWADRLVSEMKLPRLSIATGLIGLPQRDC
jgi:hypothetical protein